MVAKSKVVTQKVLTIEEQEQQELNRALDFYPFCPTKPEMLACITSIIYTNQ